MAERLNPQESRQGERGKSMLWVLVASLALLAVATIGLLTWNGANSPKDYASQDSSRREVTGSVSGQSSGSSSNATGVPGGNPAYPQPAQPNVNGAAPR